MVASQVVCRAPIPPPDYSHIRDYRVYVVTKPSSRDSFPDQGQDDDIDDLFSSSSSLNRNNADSNNANQNDDDDLIYRYTEPHVLSVEPRKGIKSGGTLLRVVGRHLACGASLSLKFTSNSGTCQIVNVTTATTSRSGLDQQRERPAAAATVPAYSLIDMMAVDRPNQNQEVLANNNDDEVDEQLDEIYCRTPAFGSGDWPPVGLNKLSGNHGHTSTSGLQLRMDDYVYVLNASRFGFEYVDDPRVASVDRESGIVSGGITMNVHGRGFDSLQTVHLFLSATPPTTHAAASYSQDDGQNNNYRPTKLNLFKSASVVLLLRTPKEKIMRLIQYLMLDFCFCFSEMQYSEHVAG